MIAVRESTISAHHNYLVNDLLTMEFAVGDPRTEGHPYIVAETVPSHEKTPRISARVLDEEGSVLFELIRNHLQGNSRGCSLESHQTGFRVIGPGGESKLEVHTEPFANGYLSLLRVRLYDQRGRLLVEPHGESIRVRKEAALTLALSIRAHSPWPSSVEGHSDAQSREGGEKP